MTLTMKLNPEPSASPLVKMGYERKAAYYSETVRLKKLLYILLIVIERRNYYRHRTTAGGTATAHCHGIIAGIIRSIIIN